MSSCNDHKQRKRHITDPWMVLKILCLNHNMQIPLIKCTYIGHTNIVKYFRLLNSFNSHIMFQIYHSCNQCISYINEYLYFINSPAIYRMSWKYDPKLKISDSEKCTESPLYVDASSYLQISFKYTNLCI